MFTGIAPSVCYYLQAWDGLGLTDGDVTAGTPYGISYSPGDIITYNTFAATFIIDEEWKVFEDISAMAIKNAPYDGSAYEPTYTDIALHLMNSTYQKEVGQVILHDGYIQSIMNVQNAYNLPDNTPPKTLQAIIKYNYHEFVRTTEQ